MMRKTVTNTSILLAFLMLIIGVNKTYACSQPKNVWVNPSLTNAFTVNWAYPDHIGPLSDFGILSSEIALSGDNGRSWQIVGRVDYPTNSFVLGNLANSTLYHVRVRISCYDAYGSVGVSPWATISFWTNPCLAPTNLSLASVDPYSASLRWNHVNRGGVLYEVSLREATRPSSSFIPMGGIREQSYTFTNLKPNTNYEFRVRALCNTAIDQYSDYSSIFSFKTLAEPCGTPTGLSVIQMANNAADLTWNMVGEAIRYEVWGAELGASPRILGITTANAFKWQNLVPGRSYVARVRSVCVQNAGIQNSAVSEEVVFTFKNPVSPEACLAPEDLTLTMLSSTLANVSWAVARGSIGYELSYSSDGGATYTNQLVLFNNHLRLSNLRPNTRYIFRVRNICSGNRYSDYTQEVFNTTLGGECLPPVNIAVQDYTENNATIVWSPVIGNSIYEVRYREETSNAFRDTFVVNSQITLPNLSSDKKYHVWVRSRCANGVLSGPVEIKFSTLPQTDCAVPANIVLSEIKDFSVRVSWTNNPKAVSYMVGIKADHQSDYMIRLATTNSITIDGLSPNTTYQVKVYARCSVFEPSTSDWSDLKTFRTSGPIAICQNPVNLRVEPTSTSARISWNPVVGSTEYEVWLSRNWGQTYSKYASVSTNGVEITGLQPNRAYIVRLKAICNNFSSQNSSPLQFATYVARSEAEGLSNNNLIIYPNPSTGVVNIQLESIDEAKVEFKVFNVSGQVVKKLEFSAEAGLNNYGIDLTGQPSGMYVIRLTQGGSSIDSKLILH